MAGQLGTIRNTLLFLMKKVGESLYINFVPVGFSCVKSFLDGFVPR